MELLIKKLNLSYPDFLIMFTEYSDNYHVRVYRKPYKTNSQELEDYKVSKKVSTKTLINGIEEIVERYKENLK